MKTIKLQAFLLACICAVSSTFSACDALGGLLGGGTGGNSESTVVDNSSLESSSSSGKELPSEDFPQLLATPIDVTDILTNEDGSTKLKKGDLGGSITLRGTQYNSCSSGWSHVEGKDTDTVRLTNYGYVFQSGFVGEEYYMEGVFDSTEPSFMAGRPEKVSTGWAGLLIAHGATKSLGGAGAYKITATIHESNILLQITHTWNNGGYATIFANWKQMFTEEELAVTDLTAVKLGVLRYGENEFAFYVNDRYVGSRKMNNVVMATNATQEIIAECGIGVMGEQLNGTDTGEIICDFKYTADERILNAMAALVPEKSVDLYLIAGQSNASGNSTYTEADMRAESDTTYYGNNNVYYVGKPGADRLTLARVGQGDATNKIGPEVGIAEALQVATYGEGSAEKKMYDATLGNYAAIVKRAVGGTSLLDDCTSNSDQSNGNWCPPSYAKELGKAYDSTSTAATGRLYRELVALTVDTVREFQEMGFTKIKICGLFWMQGERNRGNDSGAYQQAFKYLVKDLRADFAEQVGKITGQGDFKNFSVFVGKISETFDSATPSMIECNRNFIATQSQMVLACGADPTIGNVYIVESADFELNKMIDGVDTPCGADLGGGNHDNYHWNQFDMYDIGVLAGQQMGKVTATNFKKNQ